MIIRNIKIYEHGDLSDEFITKLILDSTPEQLMAEFDKLTKIKRNHQVLHSIFYRIINLYVNGKLNSMNYNNRGTIEKYFRFSLDAGSQMIERVKQVM